MALVTHTFLRVHRDTIVRAWEEAVLASGGAVALTGVALRDHVPEFLDELANWLEHTATGTGRLTAAAVHHAAQRLENALELKQVIEEFRLLRGEILKRLLEAETSEQAREAPEGIPDRVLALARLNDGLDFAIGDVVEHFSTERERRLKALAGADEALREREDFLRRVIDATPSLVFVKNIEGRYVLANDALARAYGTTVEGLIGKSDADFNPDHAQVDAFRRADRAVIAEGLATFIEEEPVTTADRGLRWFATIKVPLVGRNGAHNEVLGIATDITDRKRAEEGLRAADRQKDQFLAMLAHELRNPLAAITSAVQVIRGRLAQGTDVTHPLAILERQVRNSARLLDDLLDVSRITRGALHLKKEDVRVDAVVGSAVDAQRAAIDAAGHHLTISMPHEPVFVEADPTRLEQVVSNLLNNAAKYTPDGGRIEVAVERSDGEVLIRVSDNGPGVSPELLPRIFDAFVQEQQPLARTKGGLGLGLSIVRRLVEMHGGNVEARSARNGKGSDFVVSLPFRRLESPAPSPRATARAPGPGATSSRILVVEDNVDAAELLGEYLESLGHEVTIAHDAVAALEAAARVHPEVALLDIGLPGMDGYELARRLSDGQRSGVPVLIAVTGYGEEEARKQSRDAGFSYHLTKPYDAPTLERLLEHVAARRRN